MYTPFTRHCTAANIDALNQDAAQEEDFTMSKMIPVVVREAKMAEDVRQISAHAGRVGGNVWGVSVGTAAMFLFQL
jgi:hypothetical protein